jgi:hypothetical protein
MTRRRTSCTPKRTHILLTRNEEYPPRDGARDRACLAGQRVQLAAATEWVARVGEAKRHATSKPRCGASRRSSADLRRRDRLHPLRSRSCQPHVLARLQPPRARTSMIPTSNELLSRLGARSSATTPSPPPWSGSSTTPKSSIGGFAVRPARRALRACSRRWDTVELRRPRATALQAAPTPERHWSRILANVGSISVVLPVVRSTTSLARSFGPRGRFPERSGIDRP